MPENFTFFEAMKFLLEVIFRDIGSNAGKSGGKLWHVKYLMLLVFSSDSKDLQNSPFHTFSPCRSKYLNLLDILIFPPPFFLGGSFFLRVTNIHL